MPPPRCLRVALIKPSHYDDDGYVIQWLRSSIPSNSLASLYGVLQDCADRKVLGDDVALRIDAYDETNRVIPIRRIIEAIQQADAGFVGLVGVQSNQYPRALDLARQFRAAGIPVILGGFHVAGSLAMLPGTPPEIEQALQLGVSLYAGEVEGRMDEVLRDVLAGRAKPVYNYMSDLPGMESTPVPFLPSDTVEQSLGSYTSFDAGRGCPFQCSFCTIINVQGRKSRFRSADDIERIIRQNEAQGIRRYFITDDNFARNKNWEAIFDRMIALREEQGLRFKFIIQVDTLCHKTPNFIEKAVRAGCNRVFIGLENVDPDALMSAKKRQNKIWEYREMLLAWKRRGVVTYAGYILGFPEDTPEKIRRNLDLIKRELPLDMIEFFFLTPLPGSEDHKVLWQKGVWMDPDLNKYDLNHRVSHHPLMSDAAWEQAYLDAWKQYYTLAHIETVVRRTAALGQKKTRNLALAMGAFYGSIMFERVHPLEAGVFRRKIRTQRRLGLPLENPLLFYPRRVAETVRTHLRWLALYLRIVRLHDRVMRDPDKAKYLDRAMTTVAPGESDALVAAFADHLPQTYGAPTKAAAQPRTAAAPPV